MAVISVSGVQMVADVVVKFSAGEAEPTRSRSKLSLFAAGASGMNLVLLSLVVLSSSDERLLGWLDMIWR